MNPEKKERRKKRPGNHSEHLSNYITMNLNTLESWCKSLQLWGLYLTLWFAVSSVLSLCWTDFWTTVKCVCMRDEHVFVCWGLQDVTGVLFLAVEGESEFTGGAGSVHGSWEAGWLRAGNQTQGGCLSWCPQQATNCMFANLSLFPWHHVLLLCLSDMNILN